MNPEKIKNFHVKYTLNHPADNTAKSVGKGSLLFKHEAIMVAYNEREIIGELRERGASPLEITPVKKNWTLLPSVSRNMKLQILQSTSFNTRAGLSPTRAFEQVALSIKGAARIEINDALRGIAQGRSLVEALDLLGWYDESTIAILRSGESTGQLSLAIQTAVTHYGKNSDLLKLMFGAVIWTSLDIFMAIQAIIGTRFGLIPSVASQGITTDDPDVKINFEQALAQATLINDILLIGTGLCIVGLLLLISGLLSKNTEINNKCRLVLSSIPLLGPMLDNAALSSVMAVLSSLLQGGVKTGESLKIALRATKNRLCTAYLSTVGDQLQRGESIRKSFAIEPLEMSEKIVFQSCNDAQQLSTAMGNVGNLREEMAKKFAKKFATAALLVSLSYSGIAVGFSLWVVYLQNSAMMGGAQ